MLKLNARKIKTMLSAMRPNVKLQNCAEEGPIPACIILNSTGPKYMAVGKVRKTRKEWELQGRLTFGVLLEGFLSFKRI